MGIAGFSSLTGLAIWLVLFIDLAWLYGRFFSSPWLGYVAGSLHHLAWLYGRFSSLTWLGHMEGSLDNLGLVM